MKNAIAVLVLLGAIGYITYEASIGPCERPITYSIGTVSSQFGVSKSDFKSRVQAAETIWEKALGKQLFVYKEGDPFAINLIYDERQKEVDQKQKIEFGLSAAETAFKTEDARFVALKREYDSRVAAHSSLVSRFETASREYESRVQYWNARGGAPRGEYEKLEQERTSLNAQTTQINSDVKEMNAFLDQVNRQLAIRNTAAEKYNALARSYNEKYKGGLEFDQAEYTGKAINVYEFKNNTDLTIALAHELGHALGMDHVENPQSILYYLTGDQSSTPTEEDIAELKRVCQL